MNKGGPAMSSKDAASSALFVASNPKPLQLSAFTSNLTHSKESGTVSLCAQDPRLRLGLTVYLIGNVKRGAERLKIAVRTLPQPQG